MIIAKCGSPLGEYEIHCTKEEKILIERRIVPERALSGKIRTTGLNCSCYCDNKNWRFFFCLKHRGEIFGENMADYEVHRTDADRDI